MIDPRDPRVQKLIEALSQQQGGPGRGPIFGGGIRATGGGGGQRGLANYFKAGFAGINYNPLAAQMAQGAPGLLGLNSGQDTNAPQGPPAGVGGGPPSGGVAPTGIAPPVVAPVGGPPAPSLAVGATNTTPQGDTYINDNANGTLDQYLNPYKNQRAQGDRGGFTGLY